MHNFLQDFRFGLRMLCKNPGFTTVAVLVLAIGIGVNTAIFSLVNSVLLQPLPYPGSQRLMLVRALSDSRHVPVSYTEFLAWKDQKELFEDSAAFINSGFALTGVGEPEQLRGMMISAALFPMLGVKPAAGRLFLSEEDVRTANPVAMITHSFREPPAVWAAVFNIGGVTLRISTVADFTPHEHTILGFNVSDVVATVKALREKSLTFNIYPGFPQNELGIFTLPGGTVRVAWFKDPDGNVLSVTNA